MPSATKNWATELIRKISMSTMKTGRRPKRSASQPKAGPPKKMPISGEAPTRPWATVPRCRSAVSAVMAMPMPPMT